MHCSTGCRSGLVTLMTRGSQSDRFPLYLHLTNVQISISYVSPGTAGVSQLDEPLDTHICAERISEYGTSSDGRRGSRPENNRGKHPDTHAHGAGDA